MPIYQYQCQTCQSIRELSRQVEDRDKPVECDPCQTEMVRQFAAPEIKFNGTGFYSTDK